MADRRFDQLHNALLEAGVAEPKVRRAVMEIESHFRQLVEDECQRGASAIAARSRAHVLLGTNETLVLSYAARPELRSWARCWPALGFVLLPLVVYVGICAATLLSWVAVAEHLSPYLHRIHVAPKVTSAIHLAASVVFLGIFPLLVSAVFAVLGFRRRVSIRWPFAGIALVGVLASMINVEVRVTGGPSPGEVGAGIGFSAESLPGQITRAVILVSLAIVPLWLAIRRRHRDALMN